MRRSTLGLVSGLALLVLAVPSTGAFADEQFTQEDRTFYLRGTGCGATEAFYLSTEFGTDDYDGCGIIGGLPVQEVIHQVDGPTPSVFAAEDGVPLYIDGTKDVTGTIRAESWFGSPVPGVGQVIVDVALEGTKTNNQFLPLGSDSVEVLNSGAVGTQVNFTIDIPATADKVKLKELTFMVEVHGVNWNSGNLGLSGDSRFTLPVLIPVDHTHD
jgi:hypothetical protein